MNAFDIMNVITVQGISNDNKISAKQLFKNNLRSRLKNNDVTVNAVREVQERPKQKSTQKCIYNFLIPG